MREMHARLWRMLVLVDDIAKAAGITYFLAYGSAIGAVREGALIPWDPDVDILVPRQDYERLCAALVDDLPADVTLLDPRRNANYEFAFARVTQANIDHKLLYLDLFPLAPAPVGTLAQAAYSRISKVIRGALLIKRVELRTKFHWPRSKKLLVHAAKAALSPVPGGALVQSFHEFERRAADPDSPVLTNSCGSYGPKEFFPREWFASTVDFPLSGRPFPLPVGYHQQLTQVYGDYMRPVSREQQVRELEFCSEFILPALRANGFVS